EPPRTRLPRMSQMSNHTNSAHDPSTDSASTQNTGRTGKGLTRRRFLFQIATTGAGMALLGQRVARGLEYLQPVRVTNPLSGYPQRGWEKVYRDLYRSDSTFTFLCAPNDTHNCLLHAHLKNGVITRI